MLLEVARCLAERSERPGRGVMLLSCDMEEVGLWGSRYFAEHSPVPLDRIKLCVTADMISRSLGGVGDDKVFVFGSEYAPGLRPWVERASAGRNLTVGLLGSDIIDTVIYRSDYGPFKARRVPFLFFSTGENPRYHTPRDTPETLDYPKMTAISRTIDGVIVKAATAAKVPAWTEPPEYAASEPAAIRDAIRSLLDHRERLRIGPNQALLMRTTLARLDAIVARGQITPAERAGVVNVARLILVSVL
jgi:Zn-dependent M28 family amino/carboxypeptidase